MQSPVLTESFGIRYSITGADLQFAGRLSLIAVAAVFAIFVLLAGLLLAFAGIAWFPFGALICARLARSNGLDPLGFAIRGAFYSLLGVVPWILLLVRMHGKRIYQPVVVVGYGILFGGWFIGCGVLLGILASRTPSGKFPEALVLLSGFVMGSISLLLLIRRNRLERRRDRWDPDEDRTLDLAYASPFAFALAWLGILTFPPTDGWAWALFFSTLPSAIFVLAWPVVAALSRYRASSGTEATNHLAHSSEDS